MMRALRENERKAPEEKVATFYIMNFNLLK